MFCPENCGQSEKRNHVHAERQSNKPHKIMLDKDAGATKGRPRKTHDKEHGIEVTVSTTEATLRQKEKG
jgi:hypothetical protein